jgi:hypothetical protein
LAATPLGAARFRLHLVTNFGVRRTIGPKIQNRDAIATASPEMRLSHAFSCLQFWHQLGLFDNNPYRETKTRRDIVLRRTRTASGTIERRLKETSITSFAS